MCKNPYISCVQTVLTKKELIMNKKDWELCSKHRVKTYDGVITSFIDLDSLNALKAYHKEAASDEIDLVREDNSIDYCSLLAISTQTPCLIKAWYKKGKRAKRGEFLNGKFIKDVDEDGEWPNNFTEGWIETLPTKDFFRDLSELYRVEDWHTHLHESESTRAFLVIGKYEELKKYDPCKFKDEYGTYYAILFTNPYDAKCLGQQLEDSSTCIVEKDLNHLDQLVS